MDPNVVYSSQQSPTTPNQLAQMKGVPYNEAIGSVLWPAVVSRPDIAYAIGVLSQFIQNLGRSTKKSHIIFEYDKGSVAYFWWWIKGSY